MKEKIEKLLQSWKNEHSKMEEDILRITDWEIREEMHARNSTFLSCIKDLEALLWSE